MSGDPESSDRLGRAAGARPALWGWPARFRRWLRPAQREPAVAGAFEAPRIRGLRRLSPKATAVKWVTRDNARVDRIACPWLISRFIDPAPVFLFVPADKVLTVAKRERAIPYDLPGVELGHRGDGCSFDAFLREYRLADPALAALALIVRGADKERYELAPESAGLYAAAIGFQVSSKDDFDNMARQFPMYDALYAYCRERVKQRPRSR